jgi:diguanylate cyclase (GGDEF)-like protein
VGEYDRALEYYRQGLAADRAAGRTANVSTGLYNIGRTLESKGSLAAALPYYRQSLAMEQQRGDPAEAAYVQQSIGVVLSKMGRHAEALRWLDGALAFFVRTHDADREPRARLSRAVALRGLGRPAEALRELDSAAAYFQRTSNTRFMEKVRDERAQDLAATGDWAGAYRERVAQMALQQAMAEQSKQEQTSRLRVQFDSEKTEAENRALVRENALRGRALADAARIRRLQTAVLLLMLAVAGVLALLVARHVAAERRMRSLAMTDELTRLPNRRHLLSLAHDGLQEARRASQALSVLALDVDHFKRINDTFGHEVGDEVLRRVAQACRAALRLGDSIGRTGGEEFAVVLPGTGLARATEVAERLRVGVEHLQWTDLAPGLTVTVSVGVAARAPRGVVRRRRPPRRRLAVPGQGTRAQPRGAGRCLAVVGPRCGRDGGVPMLQPAGHPKAGEDATASHGSVAGDRSRSRGRGITPGTRGRDVQAEHGRGVRGQLRERGAAPVHAGALRLPGHAGRRGCLSPPRDRDGGRRHRGVRGGPRADVRVHGPLPGRRVREGRVRAGPLARPRGAAGRAGAGRRPRPRG